MARILALALLVGAAAVREETTADARLELGAESLLEESLEEEMQLVPAKISKAIRRAGRMAEEAMKAAEATKANMTEAKEEAAKKAEAAAKQKEATAAALTEAAKKRDEALAKEQEKMKAMESNDEAQAAWKAAQGKLAAKKEEVKTKDAEYRALTEEVSKKMQQLADEKLAAFKALEALKDECTAQEDEAEKLKNDATAKGGIQQDAAEAAEAAEKECEDAETEAQHQQTLAEKAQNELTTAKAEEAQAVQSFADASTELEKKKEMFQLVESIRNKTDDFYKALDKMTTSMEATLKGQKGQDGAKPAYEVFREDPNVKESFVAYNEMVLTFRLLHRKSEDYYHFVAGSIKEIHDNAAAAAMLQCDPTEELEMAAEQSGNKEELHQKCGSGVWKDLKLQQQRFPKVDKEKKKNAQLPDSEASHEAHGHA
mmetsp:Transcript_15912/g.29925  ORF Transcript_15912/g.29925 Transcript_15912/m.29925 type:complete len:429 (+) Transcript_15912:73-1359(+)